MDHGIYTEHAHHVTIKRCIIRNLNPRWEGKAYGGGHGIALRLGSHHNRVIACKSYGVLEHFVVGEDGYENEFVDCEAYNIGVVGFSHTDGLVARFGAHDNRFIRCKSIGCTHGISVWTMEPNPNARWITENVQRRNLFRRGLRSGIQPSSLTEPARTASRKVSVRWDPKLKRWVKDNVTSPCIDAGDPKDDFSNEPQPNGGRIIVGAYGTQRGCQ